MTQPQFIRFSKIRTQMRDYTDSLLHENAWILEVQRELYRLKDYPEDELETPIVYNLALEEVTQEDGPCFIIVADNPGLQEQKAKNHRYLVGQAGKLAVSWFRSHLDMDFRATTIIINKTPIHTPKTAELRLLLKIAGEHRDALAKLLSESQKVMARFACEFAECLQCPLWISGLGELGQRGIFSPWAEELRARREERPESTSGRILLFRHFSMNQFAIEYTRALDERGLREKSLSPVEVLSLLNEIGTRNSIRILSIER